MAIAVQMPQRDVRGELIEMVQVNRQIGRGDLIEGTVAGEAEKDPFVCRFEADRLAAEIDELTTMPLDNLLRLAERVESA